MVECEKMILELLVELDKMSLDAIEHFRDKVLDSSEIHENSLEFTNLLFEVALKRALKKQKVSDV